MKNNSSVIVAVKGHLNRFHQKEGISMLTLMKRLFTDEEGASVAEYAVLLVLILVVVYGLIRAFGRQLARIWSRIIGTVTGR